jgi:ABC transport system ATP-binding/permease protein
VQIGSFQLRVDGAGNIGVFDTRAKMRIDAVDITRDVSGRLGTGKIRLLDNISLSIQPNEFVGLLGPSGAGKSTLMEALCGSRPATGGNVLINNLDLYRHFDSLKQAIGFVPQDDIIHKELTVYKTLYYVAKLRLSRDVSRNEITKMIDEVLDVTGLSDRRDVPVHKLSGGQRKRVSIAVELVTKPSVLFLDEPTSGLDPATEDKIMQLFRQIAEAGRTVVITTHAMENVKLFDKIAVLMKGKLVFFGKPEDALTHLGANSFKDLYEKLEASVDQEVEKSGGVRDGAIADRAAEEWRQRYLGSPQYTELVQKPLSELGQLQKGGAKKKRRLGIFGSIRQWLTLSRRYAEVLIKDRLTLLILLAQAPIIAFLTFFVMGAEQPRDFVYFVLALVAVWFGTSVSAREIVRERPIYRRERMFNLGIFPYIASKIFVLGVIVTVQCLLLFVPLKLFDLVGLMAMPGELFGIPQLWAMLLTAGVGVSLGLFVSALVKTPERATSLVPLILIPQILFSGLVGVPSGINKVIGLTMPSAWSFDTMKRFSTLDTLEPEGAQHRGPTRGLGLYGYVEAENERTLSRAQKDLEDFKKLTSAQTGGSGPDGENPLADRLVMPELKKIPSDLSGYVTFLHPWMHEVLNQLVLMLMFGLLSIFTLVVMRLKDSG